jgi:hypothetical protein
MTIFTAVALYFLDAGVWWWVAYGVYVVSDFVLLRAERRMR